MRITLTLLALSAGCSPCDSTSDDACTSESIGGTAATTTPPTNTLPTTSGTATSGTYGGTDTGTGTGTGSATLGDCNYTGG